MSQVAAVIAIRYFLVDFVGGIVSFPFWWYTRGLSIVAAWAARSVRNAAANVGLGVWIKNLFVPMYGETAISGRLISFFIRLFMVVVRSIGVLAWSVLVALLFAAYLIVLPAAVIGLLYHSAGIILT